MTAFVSQLGASGPAPRFDAAYLAWNTVASYDDHADAQRAVDLLAERDFPVETLDIVGSDVRLVERVTGRMTRGRSVVAGVASGMWMGMFAGALLGLITGGLAFGLLTGLALGAAWGAGFAFVGRGDTRGRQGYASARTLMALRYDLIGRDGQVDVAREMLAAADRERAGFPGTTL